MIWLPEENQYEPECECDLCGERGATTDAHPNDPEAMSVCESCASALAGEDEE